MPVPSRRRIVALAVLGVWAGIVAWHIRREYFKPLALRIETGARALAPGSRFYAVRMEGRTIGLASSTIDTVPEGFVLEELLQLDVPALDTLHRAVVRTRVALSQALELRDFVFDLSSEVGRFTARGTMRDSVLALDIGAGGDVQHETLPFDDAPVLPGVLPLRLAAAGRLEVGEHDRVRIFDPSTLAERGVEIRVGAHDTLLVPADSVVRDPETGRWTTALYDTVPAWHVEEAFGGVVLASWVDADGRLIRATSPLGFTLERAPYEVAREAWIRAQKDARLAAGYGTVIEATAIAAGAAVDDIAVADRLAVRLLDVPLSGFDLTGGRQSLSGDTLRVVREDAASLEAGYRLPYRGAGEPAEALSATALIQAEDPRITETALRIAGGETDPVAVARKLNAWVYRTLEKDVTLSIPSAVQVLAAGEGDCNEHTVLYVALARALGLPARTAAGLVHIRGKFYYHAWPEVWLGRWVAVDPTLGQFPADASHLRLLVGGLARQVELIRLIGRLRLEVVPPAVGVPGRGAGTDAPSAAAGAVHPS